MVAAQLRVLAEHKEDEASQARYRHHASKLHNPREYMKQSQNATVKKHSQSQIPLEYEPRLLGYLAYDPVKKALTRFDMVALGDVRGRPIDENLFGERLGRGGARKGKTNQDLCVPPVLAACRGGGGVSGGSGNDLSQGQEVQGLAS